MAKIIAFEGVSLVQCIQTEGISPEEVNDLLTKGESMSWVVSAKSEELITFTCKYPHSKVTFFILPHNNKTSIVVSHTVNEEVSTVEIWERNEKVILEKIEVIPTIYAKDFFSEKNQFNELSKYDEKVFYFVDTTTRRIKASLNIGMEKDFENREADYAISMHWNGEDFDVVKTELTPK